MPEDSRRRVHIIEFLRGVRRQAPSVYKRRRVAEIVDGTPDVDLEHPRVREILDTYLHDDALDVYFARRLLPGLLAAPGPVNYVLTALVHFASRQLTMRRLPELGCQRLVQFGALDGHACAVGMVDNVWITADIVPAGAAVSAVAPLSLAIDPQTSTRPRVFDQRFVDYLAAESPLIGVLVIVARDDPAETIRAVHAAWPRIDEFGDVIVQGSAAHVDLVLGFVLEQAPALAHVRHESTMLDGDGRSQQQTIAVFQRNPADYRRLVPALA